MDEPDRTVSAIGVTCRFCGRLVAVITTVAVVAVRSRGTSGAEDEECGRNEELLHDDQMSSSSRASLASVTIKNTYEVVCEVCGEVAAESAVRAATPADSRFSRRRRSA